MAASALRGKAHAIRGFLTMFRSLWKAAYGQAYLLLTLTALMWGGNAIAGRLAVGQVSPMMLTCLRWVIVVSVLLPLIGRRLAAAWPTIRARWIFVALMGAFGFTAFN